ncbi:hypothetical protein COCON_G00171500 [Conger conger]|uniref:Ig-like domain-containing protein n=1 Tax=Conger conger TaxID=82655 RepID=A0A9Q1D7V3_CONCO|nr:hypothetical protein COCON_G00171500 [Conger conger]
MMKIKMRVLSWFLSLICAIRTEGLSVRGPAMPLLVQLGASVTLPCSVDTPIPLHELEVQWMRDSGSLVHLFLGGKIRTESQSPAYSGRAEFFTEEISKGNFSLLLRNVTTEDRGMYKCVVHTERESSEANVTIDTERLVVTGADVPVFAYAGEDVILNCSVDTHVPLGELQVEWMKTNEEILVLLFMEGQYRPESQPERFRGRAEFFIEEIPKGNFSMKLRDVKTEDRGEFMCIVHTDIESVNATAYVQKLGFSNWHIGTLVLSMAAAVFAVFISIPVLRCIQNEDKSNRALLLYYIHVSVPCILISIAFALWGTIEGSFREAYVCSVINLMRILRIFKMSPYKPPGPCHIRVLKLAVPLEMFVITAGFNSVDIQPVFTDSTPENRVLLGVCFGGLLLFGLIALCVSGPAVCVGSSVLCIIGPCRNRRAFFNRGDKTSPCGSVATIRHHCPISVHCELLAYSIFYCTGVVSSESFTASCLWSNIMSGQMWIFASESLPSALGHS